MNNECKLSSLSPSEDFCSFRFTIRHFRHLLSEIHFGIQWNKSPLTTGGDDGEKIFHFPGFNEESILTHLPTYSQQEAIHEVLCVEHPSVLILSPKSDVQL